MASAPAWAQPTNYEDTSSQGWQQGLKGLPVLGQFLGGIFGYMNERERESKAKQFALKQAEEHDVWLDNVRKAQARAIELMGGLPAALGPQVTTGTYDTNRTSNWSTTPGVTEQGKTVDALALKAVQDDVNNPVRFGDEQIAAVARQANANKVAANNVAARSGAGGIQRAMLERKGSGAGQIAAAQNQAPIVNAGAVLNAFNRASAFGAKRTGRKGTNVATTSGTTRTVNPQDLGSIGSLILPQDAYQNLQHGEGNIANLGESMWQPGDIARTPQARTVNPTFEAWLQSRGMTVDQWAQTPQGRAYFGTGNG